MYGLLDKRWNLIISRLMPLFQTSFCPLVRSAFFLAAVVFSFAAVVLFFAAVDFSLAAVDFSLAAVIFTPHQRRKKVFIAEMKTIIKSESFGTLGSQGAVFPNLWLLSLFPIRNNLISVCLG